MFQLSRTFTLSNQSQWQESLEAIIAMMGNEDFELLETSAMDKLVFVRGSWISTAMAFSPKQWKVVARVFPDVLDSVPRICLELDVSTTGQIVTASERDYFIALLKQIHQDLHAVVNRLNIQDAMVLYGQREHALIKDEAATRQNFFTVFSFFVAFPAMIVFLTATLGVPWLIALAFSFVATMTIWNIYLFSKKT